MANQIVVSAGAKVRNLQDVIIGTSGVLTSLGFDVANGVPRLDVNGKILVSQLPNSVMEYKGVWNAATNTPTLANGTGNQGDVYLCNVAGTVDFGAGPIAFVVGDQVIYSGSIWQRASGSTGTVTSVAVTESGDSLNITGSPITTSGTINIGFNGTNLQYVNGAGNLTTFPTLMTSVGLTMPSAFTVTNSPLTGAGGTLAVTGAGVASQYIRGDGTLADFPSSGGGGSSVSYYLNGGTSQGTIGGTTYYEMSKIADTGTGVDFTKSGDGFIVAFLTDANDPAQLNIPAGNWNYEIYASMSSNGGTPQLYAELYVYNGTTFTLISTSSNEILYDGTNLNLYSFAMTVPATTLALTDRLAIKLYATNSGGKTTTVHTQDSHLCQVITTFSTGITALNGLTAQVQYFQVGTSGTDFNISSTTATHTFNIPDASATARGLITTGTQTIAGTKTFSDATKNNGGIFLQNASSNSLAGYMNLGGLTNGVKFTSGGGISNTFTLPSATGYTFTFPNATGTLALTSDLTDFVTLSTAQTISGIKTFSSSILSSGIGFFSTIGGTNYGGIVGTPTYFQISAGGGSSILLKSDNGTNAIIINTLGKVDFGSTIGNGTYTYTLPSATGTLALTSALSSYLPLAGGTLTGALGGTSASFSSTITAVGYSKFWDATQGLLIGAYSGGSGFGAIYSTGVTPAAGNFALAASSGTTILNAPSGGTVALAVNSTQYLQVLSTGFTFFGSLPSVTSYIKYNFYAGVNQHIGFRSSGGIATLETTNDGVSANVPMQFAASQYTFGSGGNVQMGTAVDSGYRLDVVGTGRFSGTLVANYGGGQIRIGGGSVTSGIFQGTSTASLFIGDWDTATKGLTINVSTGAATFSSSVTATSFFESSDSRLKTLIQDNYQTKGIASITPKLYTKNGKVELGYYAQDFVGVLDSAVSKGSDDMLSLSYREVHTAKIYALEQRIKELENK
jgi:hypothetical protein